MMGYSMMRYGNNMMGGWVGMIIIPIIIIGIIAFLVYKPLQNNNIKNIGVRDNSLGILNESFARGEINEDEYNHKKDLIMNSKK
ncbi:SHOCT domain-containing protein [Clostridium sp.]|uniref:SHOCT domain-containing protein n=1 Tax=Clostridium sp. TaxID=1506 RepID=UPI002601A747|nr:SHOCT domain-containing protein [uncultured Clostridium sp.]